MGCFTSGGICAIVVCIGLDVVEENIVDDLVRPIGKVNQDPAKLLLKVVLNFCIFSLLSNRIAINPINQCLHTEYNLCILMNRQNVYLFRVAQDSSHHDNHRKLLDRSHIAPAVLVLRG